MSDHREIHVPTGSPDVPAPQAEVATADLLLALEPAHRFRCDSCGNVTRFDVTLSETTRRFHHFDLGGDHRVEEEEVLERAIRSVVCRWCGRDDTISVEPAPVASA